MKCIYLTCLIFSGYKWTIESWCLFNWGTLFLNKLFAGIFHTSYPKFEYYDRIEYIAERKTELGTILPYSHNPVTMGSFLLVFDKLEVITKWSPDKHFYAATVLLLGL